MPFFVDNIEIERISALPKQEEELKEMLKFQEERISSILEKEYARKPMNEYNYKQMVIKKNQLVKAHIEPILFALESIEKTKDIRIVGKVS